MGATRVASPRSEMGITKIHTGGDMAKTRVAQPPSLEATRIYGEPPKNEPFLGWLVIVSGKNQWQQFIVPLEDRRSTLGNGQDADIKLDEKDCDAIHASLRVREGSVFLTDLDTNSGTFVQDQAISKIELQDGDEFRIGSTFLKYRKL